MSIGRDELIAMVEQIQRAELPEKELDELLDLLQKNVPHPEVADLIYWNEVELTAEEVVDEALRYKPIQLP